MAMYQVSLHHRLVWERSDGQMFGNGGGAYLDLCFSIPQGLGALGDAQRFLAQATFFIRLGVAR